MTKRESAWNTIFFQLGEFTGTLMLLAKEFEALENRVINLERQLESETEQHEGEPAVPQ